MAETVTDLSTLGVRVTSEGIEQATAGLVRLAAAGAKSEDALDKVTAQSKTFSEALIQSTAGARAAMEAQLRAVEQFANASVQATNEERAVAAAMAEEIQAGMRQVIAVEEQAIAEDQRRDAATRKLIATQEQAIAEDERRTAATRRMALIQAEAIQMDNARTAALARGGAAATSAADGLGKFRGAAQSLATQLLGTNPLVAQTAGILGSLALGGAITVGVLAGVAAIAFAFNKLTEGARKAQEEIKRLRDESKALHSEGLTPFTAATERLAAAQRQLPAALEELAKAQEKYNRQANKESDPFGQYLAQLERAQLRVHTLNQTIVAATRQLAESQRPNADLALEINKLHALNAAYGQNVVALKLLGIAKDAEIARTKARIDLSGQELDTRLALITAQERELKIAVNNEAWAENLRLMQGLTEAHDAFTASMGREAAIIDPLIAKIENLKTRFTLLGKEVFTAGLRITTTIEQALREAPKFTAQPLSIIKPAELSEPIKNALREMQSAVTGFFENVFRGGVNSFQKLADSIKDMFIRLAAQLVALKLAEKVLSPGAALGLGFSAEQAAKFQGGSLKPAEGAPGLGAFAIATVAVIGFASALNALTGATNRSAEALDARLRTASSFLATYDQQIAQIKLQAFGTPQEQARGAVTAQFDALRQQAEAALSGKQFEALRNEKLAELNALEQVRLKQLAEEAALINKQAQEDLKVRQLRAQGQNAEADALAFNLAQQREYQKAVKDGADTLTLITLVYTQGLEAAKRAADIAAAAIKANADAMNDIAVRRLVATGDDAGAAALRRKIENEREIQAALAAGLSEATIAALKEVQALEAEKAAKDAATAAAKAAAEAARQEARALEDLNVRRLNALGQSGEADALRFQLQQQRELEDAIAQGRSQEFIDKLKEVLELERKQREQGNAQGGGGNALLTGSREVIATAAKALTEVTGNRMADYLASILIVEREQLALMRGSSRGISSFLHPLSSSIPEPRFDGEAMARWTNTGQAQRAPSTQPINVNIHIAAPIVTGNAKDADEIARIVNRSLQEAIREQIPAIVQKFNEALGNDHRAAAIRAGNTTITGY